MQIADGRNDIPAEAAGITAALGMPAPPLTAPRHGEQSMQARCRSTRESLRKLARALVLPTWTPANPRDFEVMSRGVRRIWVTVLVGLLGLAVGFTSGFAVGLLDRSVDASWLEAVGTWVGAGIILIAVILVGIAFFSEEFARRRDHRRQIQDDERVERAKQDTFLRDADLVSCDVYQDRASGSPTDSGMVMLEMLRVVVDNRSSRVIADLACRVSLHGMDWPIGLRDALGPGERHCQAYKPPAPFEVRKNNTDLHQNVEFTFCLGGAQWAKRVRQRARRVALPSRSRA